MARACCRCGGQIVVHRDGRSKLCSRCRSERDARIADAWRRGEAETEIATQEEIAVASVSRVISQMRRAGVDLPLRRHRDRVEWPQIERLWREGESRAEIARMLGRPDSTIATRITAMRRAGVDLPRRPSGRRDRGADDTAVTIKAALARLDALGGELEALATEQQHIVAQLADIAKDAR